MQRLTRRTVLGAGPITLAVGGQLLATRPVRAAKSYGPGVTDSEIKIGNTGPLQRAGIARQLRTKSNGRLLQDDQRAGWHQRP
jgi:hypothetical protein